MSNLPTVVDREIINSAVEEIEAIIVEKVYEYQSAKLDLFWETGATLRRFEKDNGIGITELIKYCAADNRLNGKQMGERNLFWAIKIYDADPQRTKFFIDKSVTLTKVKKALTSGGDAPEECLHEELEQVTRCKACKKVV